MADITPDLNICLKEKGAQPVLKFQFDLNTINSFLQEAYKINTRITELTQELRSIRPSYLSTAPTPRRRQITGANGPQSQTRVLTDTDRDAFDAQSKQLIRQLNRAVTDLKTAEEVRVQFASNAALAKRNRGGLGALGRWAAGDAVTTKSAEEEREEAERKTVADFREGVIFYLQLKLDEAGMIQGEMMQIRLSREIEKSKSVLYKSRIGMGGIPYAQDEEAPSPTSPKQKKRQSTNLSNGTSDSATQELSPEQLQMFAEENADLLKHYEDQLDQVRQAEKSILEISELHSTLHANLEQQSEHIDQLVQDSYLTTENLGKGNKELKRASERRSTAQAVFWGTVGFCSFLVVWDLIF